MSSDGPRHLSSDDGGLPPSVPPPGWTPPAGPAAWAPPTGPPAPPPSPPQGPPGGGPGPAPGGPWGPGPGHTPKGPGRLLPLRPLTVGDTLDGAFRALRATFATAALVILLVQGPYQLLSSLALTQGLPELADPVMLERVFTEGTVDVALATRTLTYVGIIGIVGLLVQVIVGAALVWLALRTDRGDEVGPGAALKASLACSGATLGGTVLVGVVGFGAAVVLSVVVGILFAVAVPLGAIATVLAVPALVIGAAALFGAYLLVLPIAVAEGRGAWTTFRRSLWIVRRRFWRTVGVMLLLLLVVIAVSLGFSLVLGAVSAVAGGLSWVVDAVSATASSLVTAPVTVFVALLVYLDARVRLEGYDLEVRATGASGGPWGS